MSFTEIHIAPRQRTLSITPIVLKFSLLLRDSVLFLEIKNIKKNPKKTRKPPLPYKILNLFFFTSELHQIYFTVYFVYHKLCTKSSVMIALSIEENRHVIL